MVRSQKLYQFNFNITHVSSFKFRLMILIVPKKGFENGPSPPPAETFAFPFL